MNVNLLFETVANEQSMIEEFNRRLSVLDEKKRKKCIIKPTDSANKIRKKCKQARVWGLHYAPVWNYYMAKNTPPQAPEQPASDTGTGSDAGNAGGEGGGEGGGNGGGVGEYGFVYPMSIGAENDPRLLNDELVSPELHLKPISYTYPDTEYEWKEAERYSVLKNIGKDGWDELVSNGEVLNWSELGTVINYDDNLEQLLPVKLNNVRELIKAGEIELPIVGQWDTGEYELISGNTRIALLTKLGYDPYVIVIDMPSTKKRVKKKPSTKPKKAPPKKKEKPKSSTERVRRYYKRNPEKVRKYLRDTQDDRVKRNGDRAKAVKKYGKKKMKNHDVHHPNGVDKKWTLARKDHGRDKKNENIECIYLSELMEGMAPNGPWQLIAEGGIVNSAHPYEDDSLTFKDIKEMIKRGLVGTLDTSSSAVEKLEGQNIMFSVRDGDLVFARSKGQVKSRGKNALDAAGARQMFSGRGNIEEAFKQFVNDLQTTISQMSPEQQQAMFANGSKFMDVNVVFPDSKNVIPYNKNVLVFHGTVEYDEAGNDIAKSMNDGKMFADELINVNSQKQKELGAEGSRSIVFDDSETFTSLQKLKEYVSLIHRLANEFGLDDNSTIEDYRKAWWAREIDAMGVNWTDQERTGLIERWATGTKRFGMKNIEDADKKKILREFEANQLTKMQRIVNKPLERMFVSLGVHTLKRVAEFLSANNPGVAAELKKELISSIEAVQSTDDTNRLAKLQIQLERLEDIGMDNLVPSEGLVFIYKGEPYKFTGAFSPVNQIIATLKFKKGKAEDADVDTDEPEEAPASVEQPTEPVEEPAPTDVEPEEEPVIDQPADSVVGVVTGKFQPFHAGHYSIYKAMVTKFGKENVYVVTTNDVDSIKSPFGFKEKKDIMTKMFGIPSSRIVQVKQPYIPKELLSKLPPNTMYVMAVSQKNAEKLSGMDYFKSYEETPSEERKGYAQQGYYMIAPEMQLQIDGKPISGGQIRSLMGSPSITDRAKQEIFTKIYGRFDKKTFDKVVKTSTQSEDAKNMTSTFGGDGGAKARMKRPEEVPQQTQAAPEEEGPGRTYYEPGETWKSEGGFYAAKNSKGKIKYFEKPEQALKFSRT